MSYGYAGSEWVEKSLGIKCSEVGKEVADLLGDVFLGIYHLNTTSLRKVEWGRYNNIDVVIDRPMASVDSNELTRLVLLAHDRMMRVEIRPCSPSHLKLWISKRNQRDGSLMERCPTMDNHISQIRKAYAGVEA